MGNPLLLLMGWEQADAGSHNVEDGMRWVGDKTSSPQSSPLVTEDVIQLLLARWAATSSWLLGSSRP